VSHWLAPSDLQNLLTAAAAEAAAAVSLPAPASPLDRPSWEVATLHAAADPAEVNREVRAALSDGAEVITLQLASPGQFGMPVRYEAIAGALDGLSLAHRPVVISAGDQYVGAISCLLALWEAQDVPMEARHGGVLADPLGTFASTGQLEQELWPTLEVMAPLLANALDMMPAATLAVADGVAWHGLGADTESELALVLACHGLYSRMLTYEGVTAEAARRTVGIRLAITSDAAETATKVAAIRLLMDKAYGPGRVWPVWGVTAAEPMLASEAPHESALRTAQAAAAAVQAGVQRLTVLPYTWSLGRDAFAFRIALALQRQLLARPAMALPASVPAAAEALAAASWKRYEQMDRAGGLPKLLLDGLLSRHLVQRSYSEMRSTAGDRLAAADFPVPVLRPHPPVAE
jgi:methylmalonyl-CoA mutase